MLAETKTLDTLVPQPSVHLVADAPPVAIPPGHVGPVVLPGSGRLIYWTGRVAIGLRHERVRHYEQVGQSALWLQALMLRKGEPLAA